MRPRRAYTEAPKSKACLDQWRRADNIVFRGIHRWPSPYKGPVTLVKKSSPCHDIIISSGDHFHCCAGVQSGTYRVCLLIWGSVFSLEGIFLTKWNTHLLFITRVAISFYSMCSDYVLCHWNVCQSPHSWEWASAMRAYAAWKPLYGASNSLAINSNHKPWADFPFLTYRYEVLSNIVDLCLLWSALTAVLSMISNLIALLTHGVLILLYNVMFCSKCGLIWEFQ